MPQAVLGGSPVTLVDDGGHQLSIPLGLLSFTGGKIDPKGWPGWAKIPGPTQSAVQHYLDNLAARGLLQPAPPPPVTPAMVIRALDAGSTGNFIKITLVNPSPMVKPEETTVDMTVDLVETYNSVTKANIEGLLGKDAASGSNPGLAYVSKPPGALSVAAKAPFDASGVWTGGGLELTTRRVAKATDPAPAAELVKNGANLDLVITWTKPSPKTALKDLDGVFDFLLDVDMPAGGWGVPKASSFKLLGGTDGGPPTKAQSTVPGV
ncbi:hypothetical protein QO010_002194 [Caulobacter ginsengisoli]|uniref:Uncharacterized protein n=1 Tax=Caulobacter ginsengisoli TaxID=400775 RepID=A0ABU0ITC4_9CAUL|nr:hypothetical protein [Caulobacter ginsengisoli]MDQ0464413.1 hypothetical protein [Caulobacter ginsengisoli]